MSLRLFAAIPIPETIADRLSSLESEVPGASWRTTEQYHLTLRFFGEIDEALARDLDGELGQIVEAPFEIRLAGAGSFGGREPTALWAGVEAPPDLARLAAQCERAARRAGLAPEGRKYKPHVTLAYCRGTSDHDVALFQQDVGDFRTEPFWVDHFVMYSSQQTKSGSFYREEAVYPLTGTPAPTA
ncbi:MAG TPA: RNA 2',3'-cyclic phosphodiesterase [Hyphomonadaceae bacterium]|nr:RNA 2',3'-cyclic phosphodiesterase [Hyphomonadaceae bacterium]